MALTKLEQLVDPEVMAPMISAKLTKAIKVTPFAKIDTTLQGRAGDTITVPKFQYIGDAEDLAEGVKAGTVQLTTTTAEYKVKKAVKQVQLTDEAVLSGYGNPVGETNNQLGLAIASKIDNSFKNRPRCNGRITISNSCIYRNRKNILQWNSRCN